MAEHLGEGRRRAAQGDRRRDDGLQEGARGDRRRPRARPRTGCARRASPARQARRPRGRPGRGRGRSSTATSARSSSSTARPTSSPRATSSRGAVAALAKLVAEQGDADVARAAVRGLDGRRVRHAARRPSSARTIELGRVVRFETDRRPARRLQAHPERPRHHRRARRARRRRPGDAEAREVAHDIALHIASAAPRYVTRDDVPADVDRARARGPRGADPQRGQARAGDRRRSSRAGSTASTRTSCCSSSRS